MNGIDFLREEIFLRYGNVKRARGTFLYTEKSVRLTDLFQENGRAILGWGGASFTVLKNALDRGATGSFKTCFSHRLEKSVNELFFSESVRRKIFAFASKEDCISFATKISPQKTFFWRPWMQSVPFDRMDCIVFAPAFPWATEIFILAVNEKILCGTENSSRTIRLSSPVEAALTRSVYDLIGALKIRGEKNWFVYDKIIAKYWTRKGPYLFPKIDEAHYKKFLLHCLDLGIVVNPDFHEPSIVPFGADEGVFNVLKKNPFCAENSEGAE